LLIVNVTGLVTDTPVALVAGVVDANLNELVPYELEPDVNVLVKDVTVLPSASENPLIATVYTLVEANVVLGTNVRVTPSLARLIVPEIPLPFAGVKVIELLVSVVGSIVLLMTATICVLVGTSVCAFGGLIVLTVTWLVRELVPVTNVEVQQLPMLPAMSMYPQTFTAYCVFARSVELGVMVALKRFVATVTVAGTVGPPFA
jgi:hypothetical protein